MCTQSIYPQSKSNKYFRLSPEPTSEGVFKRISARDNQISGESELTNFGVATEGAPLANHNYNSFEQL